MAGLASSVGQLIYYKVKLGFIQDVQSSARVALVGLQTKRRVTAAAVFLVVVCVRQDGLRQSGE